MNQPQRYKTWQIRASKWVRRAGIWLFNYFALDRPLDGQSTRAGTATPAAWNKPGQAAGWNVRTGQALFYIGLLAGCLCAYFFLSGSPSAVAVSQADARSLAGIVLGVLLYPAVHRAGRFGDLRSLTGSLLVPAMYGFIATLIVQVLLGA